MNMLTLTVTAYQGKACPPQSRQVDRDHFTIGRGAKCDWELPDPSGLLSRVHCSVDRVGDNFTITDVSTNGTYLNGSVERLGLNVSATLANGDVIKMGEYRIHVELENRTPTVDAGLGGLGGAADLFPPLRPAVAELGSVADDPLLGLLSGGRSGPFDPLPASPAVPFPPAVDPPSGRDAAPMPPMPSSARPGGPVPDHVPSVNQAFQPPGVQPQRIPTDWNVLEPGEAAVAPPPAPPPPPPQPRVVESVGLGVTELRPAAPAGVAVRAFLDGAGLGTAVPGTGLDDIAQLRAYGMLFREVVAGLRELIGGRSDVRNALHVPRTVITARDNNPFKFSVDVDQLVAALLIADRAGYSEPLPAVREAVADLKAHEVALVAAIREAVGALVDGLSPDAVRRQADAAGLISNLLPAARKAAWWERYEELHRRAAEGIEADQLGGFRRNFAEAYAKQAEKL